MRKKIMKKCSICGSDKTYIDKRGYENWFILDGQYSCKKCYRNLVYNPIFNPKWNKIYNPRRIRFKDKQIILEENPRKGVCLICNKKIGDEYINYKGLVAIIKRTHLHHIEYNYDDILKDTIELCVSCHRKETTRIEKEPKK